MAGHTNFHQIKKNVLVYFNRRISLEVFKEVILFHSNHVRIVNSKNLKIPY